MVEEKISIENEIYGLCEELGFFVNYCILTGLFLLISKFISNIYWIIVTFVVVYLIL